MRNIDLTLVIHRYEAIVALIILILTGSITVSSRGPVEQPADAVRYPYRIALTFDDGPHAGFTPRLIAVLRAKNVRATFFVVGSKIVEKPELLKDLAAAGHEIAGHTFTHRNLAHLGGAEIAQELSRTRGLIASVAGKDSLFFRPPGGQYDREVVAESGRLGYVMVLWTVFPKDHEEDDPAAIVRKVLAQASDDGTVLLHSGREPTIAALPEIIDQLRSRGYRFVTVNELYGTGPRNQTVWLKSFGRSQKL